MQPLYMDPLDHKSQSSGPKPWLMGGNFGFIFLFFNEGLIACVKWNKNDLKLDPFDSLFNQLFHEPKFVWFWLVFRKIWANSLLGYKRFMNWGLFFPFIIFIMFIWLVRNFCFLMVEIDKGFSPTYKRDVKEMDWLVFSINEINPFWLSVKFFKSQ